MAFTTLPLWVPPTRYGDNGGIRTYILDVPGFQEPRNRSSRFLAAGTGDDKACERVQESRSTKSATRSWVITLRVVVFTLASGLLRLDSLSCLLTVISALLVREESLARLGGRRTEQRDHLHHWTGNHSIRFHSCQSCASFSMPQPMELAANPEARNSVHAGS